MRATRVSCVLLLALCLLASSPAVGQRIQFSSQVPPAQIPSAGTPSPYGTPGGGSPYTAPGGASAYPYPAQNAASPYPTPSSCPPPSYPPAAAAPASPYPGPASPYPAPASAAPAYPAPAYPAPTGVAPAYPAPAYPAPGSAPTYPAPGAVYPTQPPMATLEGTIQSPPPQWDPYAPPGSAVAPSLLPQDPRFQIGPPGGYSPVQTWTTMQRFLKELDAEYLWMPDNGPKPLGLNDAGLSATFAVPFFYNMQTPLLITPGFMAHFWSGPNSVLQMVPTDNPPADLPPVTYDAYLDTAWNPQPTPWFGGELSFRVGVYSDFKRVVTRSLRFTGAGLAVLTFSPSLKFKVGVEYLDRNLVKLLPAGGVVWTPNPDVRFDILFPHPKVAKRLTTYGCTEWWAYLKGDYGGGAWTVRRADIAPGPGELPSPAAGITDFVDYDDLRAALGLEFMRVGGFHGFFESGVAFERQLRYRSLLPEVYRPTTTVFLHAGLGY